MNTSSLGKSMLENVQLSMLVTEISTLFCNLDKIFLLLLSCDSIFHRFSCMLSPGLFKYPAFFVSLKGLRFHHINMWGGPGTSATCPHQRERGRIHWWSCTFCAGEVPAAFSTLSKAASTVPAFLPIFVFYPVPQSHADMLLYRIVSSVWASRDNREERISQGHSPVETLHFSIWGNTAVFQMKY